MDPLPGMSQLIFMVGGIHWVYAILTGKRLNGFEVV